MEVARQQAGVATIKKEFICPDWLTRHTAESSNSAPPPSTNNNNATDLKMTPAVQEEQRVESESKQEPASTNPNEEKPSVTEGDNDGVAEPPAKKHKDDNGISAESATAASKKQKKQKGQNKKRGLTVPKADLKTRMCKLHVDGNCRFGDDCKFSHDVLTYLKTKKPDIGDKCVHFDKKGRCPYGLECRYGSSHINLETGKNLVDEERASSFNALPPQERNITTNKLGDALRRRKYRFTDSVQVLKVLDKPEYVAWKQDDVKKGSAEEVMDDVNGDSDDDDDSEAVSTSASDIRKYLESCKSKASQSSTDKSCSPGKQTNGKSDVTTAVVTEPVPKINEASSPNVEVQQVTVKLETSQEENKQHNHGCVTDQDLIRLRKSEIKKVDFSNKLYLAPLTTVGNLPFRRVCKKYGADITCGEMALSKSLLQGRNPELALLKRHESEDIFGVQVCGSYPDLMTRCTELLNKEFDVDFIDINMGCPIDLVFKKGEGSALMGRMTKLRKILLGMTTVSEVPITVKMRTGIYENKFIAHKVIPLCREWGASLATLHGRTREQRYTKLADWEYINECAKVAAPMPLFGNGDVLSFEDANRHREATGVDGLMIARGALIKPWIFQEIKEQRHWDISASERFDMMRDFTNYGLEHWGSDDKGVETTRKFLLEWLSFLNRYIPTGILEYPPQRINERPPPFFGRSDLETLMASKNSEDWVKISEMLLGPVPDTFSFLPKHKANSYS